MFSRIPAITKALLIANCLVFVFELLPIGKGLVGFMLWPVGGADAGGLPFRPWQLVTYAFLHDPQNYLHILFNMVALVMFGAPLEHVWGERRFFIYYMTCVIGAGLIQLLIGSWVVAQGGDAYRTLGASGGVFGLLLAYGMLFPNQRLMIISFPIPMKARTLVIIYGLIELVSGFTGLMPGVAHFAHIGGMLFGWLLIRYWRGQGPFARNGPRRLR